MTPSGNVTTLYSFTGGDGFLPKGGLIQGSDGNFYGTTNVGGVNDIGTVFKMSSPGTFTSLPPMTSARHLHTATLLTSGQVLIAGGDDNNGVTNTAELFDPAPGNFTSLSPNTMTSARYEHTATLLPSGKVLFAGGNTGSTATSTAELFDSASGSFLLLPPMASPRQFHTATLLPNGKVLIAGGYTGSTATNMVELFDPASGTFTSLSPNTMTSARYIHTATLLPSGKVLIAGGRTESGAATNTAELFDPALGTFTSLSPITMISERYSHTATVVGNGKVLIAGGATPTGATNTAELFDPGTGSFTSLSPNTMTSARLQHTATLLPSGKVLFAGGTMPAGSTNTAELFDPAAVTLTTLHSFNGSDGTFPNFCGLVEGNDGDFYGTTSAGGLNGSGFGTVFKITPSGTLTSLHSFALVDGASPSAGLTKGSDGNFYGVTFDGGPNSAVTVYKITASGTFTSLHSFAGTDGRFPFGTVIEGSDGNFYGTTNQGGASGPGTVFKMDPSGVVTTLHSFTGPDGSQPYGGLIQGSNGNFYGMTTIGGEGHDAQSGHGTVFMITPSGAFTSLHSFVGTDGKLPFGELTHGSDGNFYGTTLSGGASFNPATFTNGFGTIFKITPIGTLTTLHSFAGNAGNDGASPYGGPIQASDGSFYGTTEGGGPSFVGVAYRIAAPTVQLVSAVSRKTHGSAGAFDIHLPQTGTPGIECRSGGATNDYTLVFSFANTLTSVGGASVTTGTGSVSSSAIGSDAHQYVVNLSAITNAQVITVSLTNVNDSAGNRSSAVSASMAVLLGDTTANGAVNSSDIGQTKSRSGQTLTNSNFRTDVTADGSINSSDIGLVKSKSGTALP